MKHLNTSTKTTSEKPLEDETESGFGLVTVGPEKTRTRVSNNIESFFKRPWLARALLVLTKVDS